MEEKSDWLTMFSQLAGSGLPLPEISLRLQRAGLCPHSEKVLRDRLRAGVVSDLTWDRYRELRDRRRAQSRYPDVPYQDRRELLLEIQQVMKENFYRLRTVSRILKERGIYPNSPAFLRSQIQKGNLTRYRTDGRTDPWRYIVLDGLSKGDSVRTIAQTMKQRGLRPHAVSTIYEWIRHNT